MKKILGLFCVIITLLAVLTLTACVPQEVGNEVTFIIDRTTLKMGVGDVYVMNTTIIPETDLGSVTWESSSAEVVTCEGGVVKAIGEGKAIVKATHSSGAYDICSVTVENNSRPLYMLEGESISIKNKDLNAYLKNSECISTDPTVASVEKGEESVTLLGVKKGKSDIKVEIGESSLIYYNVIVLSKEDSGVAIATDELPIVVNYDSGKYQNSVRITGVSTVKYDARSALDQNLVQVDVIFEYEKIFDSDGDDAKNPVKFAIEIYSGEVEGILRTVDVSTGWLSVNESKEGKKTFKYTFNAMLDVGECGRSFTFKVVEISK